MKRKTPPPTGYEIGALLACEALGMWVRLVKSDGLEMPQFALPSPDVALIASVIDVGHELARNESARVLLSTMAAEFERRGLDEPTVMMLRMALEMHGVPITFVPLAELGLSGLSVVQSGGPRGRA